MILTSTQMAIAYLCYGFRDGGLEIALPKVEYDWVVLIKCDAAYNYYDNRLLNCVTDRLSIPAYILRNINDNMEVCDFARIARCKTASYSFIFDPLASYSNISLLNNSSKVDQSVAGITLNHSQREVHFLYGNPANFSIYIIGDSAGVLGNNATKLREVVASIGNYSYDKTWSSMPAQSLFYQCDNYSEITGRTGQTPGEIIHKIANNYAYVVCMSLDSSSLVETEFLGLIGMSHRGIPPYSSPAKLPTTKCPFTSPVISCQIGEYVIEKNSRDTEVQDAIDGIADTLNSETIDFRDLSSSFSLLTRLDVEYKLLNYIFSDTECRAHLNSIVKLPLKLALYSVSMYPFKHVKFPKRSEAAKYYDSIIRAIENNGNSNWNINILKEYYDEHLTDIILSGAHAAADIARKLNKDVPESRVSGHDALKIKSLDTLISCVDHSYVQKRNSLVFNQKHGNLVQSYFKFDWLCTQLYQITRVPEFSTTSVTKFLSESIEKVIEDDQIVFKLCTSGSIDPRHSNTFTTSLFSLKIDDVKNAHDSSTLSGLYYNIETTIVCLVSNNLAYLGVSTLKWLYEMIIEVIRVIDSVQRTDPESVPTIGRNYFLSSMVENLDKIQTELGSRSGQ